MAENVGSDNDDMGDEGEGDELDDAVLAAALEDDPDLDEPLCDVCVPTDEEEAQEHKVIRDPIEPTPEESDMSITDVRMSRGEDLKCQRSALISFPLAQVRFLQRRMR